MSIDLLVTWIIVIDILGKLSVSLGLLCFLIGCIILFRALYNFLENTKLKTRVYGIWFFCLFAFWSVIPSSKTLYSVVALKAGNEAIQELSKSEYTAKFKTILDTKLDEYLAEIEQKSIDKSTDKK